MIETFVELADNLNDNYDVIDVLTIVSVRCVQATGVDAAGVMLALPGGELHFVASSSESMRVLELFQIQTNEGPCVDCYVSGIAVVEEDLARSKERWPLFGPRALAHGFRSVHSLPMRLRGRTIGALNLLATRSGALDESDVAVAQGLADVATIAILQHQTSLDSKILTNQLSIALNSRIIIEQAKGMISQAAGCDMDEAFARLRAHARDCNERLTEVAAQLIALEIDVDDLTSSAPSIR